MNCREGLELAGTGVEHARVAFAGDHFRAGVLFQFGQAAAMVVVRVAVQQDLDVFDRKAERGDVLLDERRGFGQPAVQQNVAGRSPNEERRYMRADVVDIADDAKGFDGLVPGGAAVGVALGQAG